MTTLTLAAATLAAALLSAPDLAPRPPVEQARLKATLRALPTARSAAGDEAHRDGLERAQWWLHGHLSGLGLTVERQRVYLRGRHAADPDAERRPRQWENLIADLPGREEPARVLIVGAHFDAVPDTPGADDNGSGVAALLEIARVLKDRPLRRTVRLILFNLEETGLAGSSQYAARFADRVAAGDESLIGMVSLEMLGYYRDDDGSQTAPFKGLDALGLPTRGDFIALAGVLDARPFIRHFDQRMRANEPACTTFVFDFSPVAPPDILRSDHAPFLLRGWPAVMVTDTANFRNPHYHQPTDTIDTLDLPRLTRTTAALAGAIEDLAGIVGKPEAPPPNLDGLPDLSALMPPPNPRDHSPPVTPK